MAISDLSPISIVMAILAALMFLVALIFAPRLWNAPQWVRLLFVAFLSILLAGIAVNERLLKKPRTVEVRVP